MLLYLEVLLPVKHDGLGLDFAVLDIHLVATEDNGDVLTDSHQIPVPVWYILVGYS